MGKSLIQVAIAALYLAGTLSGQTLYVTNFFGNNAVQFDATGTLTGTVLSGVPVATGIAIGPDGNIYVASQGAGTILKFSGINGAFLGTFATGLTLPEDITFGPDGNLYVANYGTNQILRFNGLTGASLGVFAAGGGMTLPIDLTFGPDGNLYVAAANVYKYNGTTGAFLTTFTSATAANTLRFGPDGNLYVGTITHLDKYNGTTGAFIGLFATPPGGLLAGFTFGPDGNIYVADSAPGVLKFNGATGAFINTFATGGLNGPFFLAFGPAVRGAYQVRFAANLNVADSLINITNTGANGAQLTGPGGVAPAGNVCVNVYAFSPDEQLVSCCSCLITPNGLVSLSVYESLRSNTLTGVTPNAMVIKLVNTLAGAGGSGTTCAGSAAIAGGAGFPIVGGIAAWGTTAHVPSASVVPGANSPFSIIETAFREATLSADELASLNNRCVHIIGNGSGFGICRGCQPGGRGASRY